MTHYEMTEEEFLQSYDPKAYSPVSVTADASIFTIINEELHVLIVKRSEHPFKDFYTLPGGFITGEQDVHEHLIEIVRKKSNYSVEPSYLEQVGTYTEPHRDPRMRVFSLAYFALVPHGASVETTPDSSWVPVRLITDGQITLGFDHYQIFIDSLERVRSKLEYTMVSTRFLPEEFSLTDLRRVYEIVWGVKLHVSNFRRQVLSINHMLEETHNKITSFTTRGRSAQSYRVVDNPVIKSPIERPKTA